MRQATGVYRSYLRDLRGNVKVKPIKQYNSLVALEVNLKGQDKVTGVY